MAEKKFPRLKVFAAQIGFFETVVAASSRPKALEAWGTHQDLFAQGEAREIDKSEPEAKAALERPGEVLTRPVGDKGPFKPGAEGTPEPPKPKGKPKKPKPDRSKLDAAEAALDALEKEAAKTLAGLKAERKALDARMESAKADLAERRREAEAEVKAARKAYKARL
jgi:hypothetical protein